jgi:hypothetical protein
MGKQMVSKGRSRFVVLGLTAIALASVSAFASAKTPADVLSFAHWELQTFTNSSASTMTTVDSATLQSGYHDTFFKYVSDGGDAVAFYAPDLGDHTANSPHPRSELRELNSSGGHALWNGFDSKTHTLSATLKVTDARHRLCIGQIHADALLSGSGAASIKPLMELYYEPTGDLVVGFESGPETTASQPAAGKSFGAKVPVGKQFSYVITVKNHIVTAAVTYNGSTHTVSETIPASFKPYGNYFKAGDYNQVDADQKGSGGTKDQFYKLTVSHQ